MIKTIKQNKMASNNGKYFWKNIFVLNFFVLDLNEPEDKAKLADLCSNSSKWESRSISFSVLFFNANDEEIYSVKIANPLIKHFEVSEEDGTLERKRVEVDEETITIRTNKLHDYAYHEVLW